MPPWEQIRWASDKRNTYALADSLGIPVPRTWYPRSPPTSRNRGRPAVRAEAGDQGELHLRHRGQGVAGRHAGGAGATLTRAPARGGRRRDHGPGARPGRRAPPVRLRRLLQGRRVAGSMTARRRRQHPPSSGGRRPSRRPSTCPSCRERSERLLRAIDYYGLVELEFKQDPRNGEYKLLDFNARAWGYHTLGGAAAGVDFPALLLRRPDGTTPRRAPARPGVAGSG